MAKWSIIQKIDEIKKDLENLYIKKNQRTDVDEIITELNNVQTGVIEYMRDKSKWDLMIERHFSKEVHPNTDI